MRNNRLANELWNIKRKGFGFFFLPLIALVRLHGWITKGSEGRAVQRWGGSSGVGEAPRWVMCPRILPSFSLHSLCQLLRVSITPQSKWMVGKDYYRVKPPRLMSPVFNHHTVEWFYAYFICISLSHVSKGALRARRSTKLGRQGRKKRSLWCLSSNRGLFHDVSSAFAKIIMTWKPLKLDTTLASSNSCRAVYF